MFKKCINKVAIVILILNYISFSACKKSNWYDVKPIKSLQIPATLKDMQALMDYQDMSYYSPSLGEIGSDGHYISNDNYSILSGQEKNAYTWSHSTPYENLFEWSRNNLYGAYSRIYYCNIVLEGLKKIAPGNALEQEAWKNIKGQALFHRARSFYELAQVFSPPYNALTAKTDPSIPLRLESDINIPSKRSTVYETYEQVIGDLSLAKDLLNLENLPQSLLNQMRPTKTAVLALLARIYLTMEDYANAGKFANDCLNEYNTLLDYSTLSLISDPPFEYLNNPEIIWIGGMNMAGFLSLDPSMLLIDSSLYNSYLPGDLRKELYYIKDNITGLIAFKGWYIGYSLPFTGLASDETYLIRAECYARTNHTDLAMKDLNDLLRTRWLKTASMTTYVDQSAVDANDALKKILEERKKELLLRGLRWSDLRRLNKDERFKITLTRNTTNGIFTLEPNSFKYTFPIPDDVIAITGMQQNPGW